MGMLECPLKCGHFFSNSSELKSHLETHLTNVKCPFCFLIIENIHSLPAHLDECIIKKEADSEEEEEEEENVEYETEIVSLLPEEISDDETGAVVSVVNPTKPMDDEPIEAATTESTVNVVNLNPANSIVHKIGPSLLRLKLDKSGIFEKVPTVKHKIETQEVVSQELKYEEDSGEQTESSDEQEEIKQELLNDPVEDSQDEVPTEQEYQELSPAVQEEVVEEADNTESAEGEQNVYHCSSCNALFTDVNEHLAQKHSNQQVYLQLPDKDGGSTKLIKDNPEDVEDDMELSNLPSAANENKDQAIWVSWSGEYYLSTRSPYDRFQSLGNLNYVLRPTTKDFSVSDLSPFYMEDDYGDKFFSVPVDTAIDYFEASNGRCGPKRFVGNFARVCIGSVIKSKPESRPIQVYERIISTHSLSLTHILFSSMPPDHFLPIIVQMNPRDGCDQGIKYKIYWKCNLCGVEIDTWTLHDCDDTYMEDNEATVLDYNIVDEISSLEDKNNPDKENITLEQFEVTQFNGYNRVRRVKPPKKRKGEEEQEDNQTTRHLCKTCNIIFFKDSFFFDHVKEKHSNPKLWTTKRQPAVTARSSNSERSSSNNSSSSSKSQQKENTAVRGKYYCQPCKIMFANERWLLEHYQTDHRHKPGYTHEPPRPVEIEDVTDRTCVDCQGRNKNGESARGLVFESRPWYKLHRKTAHGEDVDPSELPQLPTKPKKPAPEHIPRAYKSRVKPTVEEPPVSLEPDEVPILDGPFEPKILRTCAFCVKVKNSIYNLRKHLRDVHEDSSIVLRDESQETTTEETAQDKESDDRINNLHDGSEVVGANVETSTQDESLYEITEEGVIKREKQNLYKFKQDGLGLEDVQNRYAEYNVLELDITSQTCELCYTEDLESQHKLLKHMELRHYAELCMESFFLVRRRLQRQARMEKKKMEGLGKKKIQVLDANNLPENLKDLVSLDDTSDPSTATATTAEQMEVDSAVDRLVEQTVEADTSTEPPASKKRKFQVIKSTDLPESVRKKIEEHSKANNIEAPLIVRNLTSEDPVLEDRLSDLSQREDRTSKLSIEVMDFLNYKQKHSMKKPKVKKPRPYTSTRRLITLTGINAGKQVKYSSVLDFTGDPTVSCMTCRVTFVTKRWLTRHKEIFHKNCTECPICSLLIQDHVMSVHMSGHSKGATGTEEDQLVTPASFKPTKDIEFTCKECNMSFESEEHLSYHKLVHQNKVMLIQKEKCPFCAAEFYEADMLRNHLKIHSSRRVYTCNYCHKYFYILAEKVVHERIHTGVKPYACETCGKAFRKKFSLTMHKRHIHLNERRYSCDICSAKFVSNSSLVVHKQRHDPTPRYKCKLCPKMFSNTGTRANHIRRKHYGAIEYVCKLCTRVFLGMSALRRHYQKHEALELKYACQYCPQVYGRSLFLGKHMKEVHPGEEQDEKSSS